MHQVTVREFARLTTSAVKPTLDRAQVSPSAFDWLCEESARLSGAGAALVEIEDRRWLKLDNYVGVIETPCGTRIEILPKHVDGTDGIVAARRLLRRMLATCLDLRARESREAMIESFSGPLSEWVMHQFLLALDRLVKRGLQFDYQRVEEEQRFLRGRLDVVRQLRQPPSRQHLFQIRHDIFSPDRAENRLLRSALERVRRLTGQAENWRLAHELSTLLQPIPESQHIAADFRRWREDRLMAHYSPVRPWCHLVLHNLMPLSTFGTWRGLSLLFPMETLFERYVEACLRRQLPSGAKLTRGACSQYLCEHRGQRWFQLIPDFLLEYGGTRWVLDTKWKRLDSARDDTHTKYGLSQADFYQLHAYGQKYLEGCGELCLVFPRTGDFQTHLPSFGFSPQLRLWVLPFDLEQGRVFSPAEIGFPFGNSELANRSPVPHQESNQAA